MGMSASQARLLSLQARMSDVEYEGQQINQQRLVLSNKMNEVMEKMTNMDVPTPPSKQDFLYNKYSGKTKNGKKISAEMNDKGNFDVKKDVAGRIVEDAGLQNITSGSQMRGSEISVPRKTADGFHVCDGDEAARYHISDNKSTSYDLTEYDTKDFHQIYDSNNPKEITLSTNPYNGMPVNGYTNKCYADDPSSTYIRVPNLEYIQDTPEGYYSGNKYYGNNESDLNKEVYYYNGNEMTYDALREATKTVNYVNGKQEGYNYLSDQELNRRYLYYKNTAVDIRTGAKEPIYGKQQLKMDNQPANGHYEQNGYTEIKIDFPLENDKYKELLKQCQTAFEDILNGGSNTNINGTPISVTGRSNPSRMAVCSPSISSITGISPTNKVSLNDIESLYTYTKFEGVDSESVSSFDSDAQYVRTNAKAAIGSGAGKLKNGSDLIQHNNDVRENLSATFFYMTSDGKFKRCSGSEAKSKVASGLEVYKEVESGGRGITDQEPDFSVIKENFYIMDGDNNAQLISTHGGIEWAIAQIKAGKKLFSKGTGDIVCYDKDLEADTTVNGCQTMSVAEANGMDIYRNSTAFQDALTGLKQSFPDNWEEFSVIIDNSGSSQSFRFCRTNDLNSVDGQVRVYTPGQGTYQEKISNVEPTYDENGYLEKLILPNGEVVEMEVEQAVDEVEYDKAMNKYNIAKIEYDKEVNELNKQTSIYQRQDKQLELKLTRLDTERNALNTEIDAVKKVIQDATEKGFKTFSG